jgi:hypothetical protein
LQALSEMLCKICVNFQVASSTHLDSNDFTYLSDHVQIELYLKCSITDETKTKLDEKRWKNIKTYKWTDTLLGLCFILFPKEFISLFVSYITLFDHGCLHCFFFFLPDL